MTQLAVRNYRLESLGCDVTVYTALVGKGGENLRQLTTKALGPDLAF
jgi:hypothetical protein